jgi:hypothetical protein
LDYCGCGRTSKGQVEQLLERRLYPATVVNPKTAATFWVLEVFELLQYESKLSTYEFYQTISRLTNNTGVKVPKVRLSEFEQFKSKLFWHPGSLPHPTSYRTPMATPQVAETHW